MANSHSLFTEFNKTIRLSEAKRKKLRKSRKSLRKKIRKFFKEEKPNEISPKFKMQGSMIMDTIVEPIPRVEIEYGEEKTKLYYDVDDGIYFIGDIEDRKSEQTYHNWIVQAVTGHTNTPPVDKPTCVRVIFSDGRNIDLPIYFKHDDIPELAHRIKKYMDSDPLAFINWFNDKVKGKPQLIRIIRFLKAWRDFRQFTRKDKKMPSGFILTILACENYYANDRDDIALKETLMLIQNKLQRKFECLRPTAPAGENLFDDYNEKDYFMKCLSNFIEDGKAALKEKNYKRSCEKWQKHFGDRFPCSLAKDEEESNENSASLASVASRSRPWANENL